ncbi:hypothetical protein HGM15179_017281, partial [Zosterops borbonicus]
GGRRTRRGTTRHWNPSNPEKSDHQNLIVGRPLAFSEPLAFQRDFPFPNFGWMEEETAREIKMPWDTQT